ncbi:fatty acid-binding protein 5-like [Mya arenaria]|uniref:fatty acid-binding protein 5-like n=1 Tax=Mya arenaria TaxID=6604 RepID=UPI0022E1B4F9|nr:fatty acid-binding protein 5-like [Mya arenaria]XP_052801855.1 fatty acid-binding protein 5-like [Mya arenaria]
MALQGFTESLAGKWLLVKNEGFDEYLQAMGVGYIKRKLALSFNTTMEMIKEGEDSIRIITKSAKNMDTVIKIDEEKEEADPFDNKIKVKVSWDPATKVLKTESYPLEGSNAKTALVERKILPDGQMLMEVTLPNDNLVCKRYFQKQDS